MANQIMPNIENFVDSTPLLDSPGELRIRAAEQGFLFFARFSTQRRYSTCAVRSSRSATNTVGWPPIHL